MIVESTLGRREFTRHALGRHFRRPIFYVYAMLAAVLTAYTIYDSSVAQLPALAAGWLPFLVYGIVGFVAIPRRARDPQLPVYQPTRYELSTKGLIMTISGRRSEFSWAEFRSWRKSFAVYELQLKSGQLLLIAQSALGARQVAGFEKLLREAIAPAPEPGVFDRPDAAE
jgi:hypothetical protein